MFVLNGCYWLFHKISKWCIKTGATKLYRQTTLTFKLIRKYYVLTSLLVNVILKYDC